MNKNAVKLGVVSVIVLVVLIGLFSMLKNIKVDEFKPSSVIFVVDASASNQQKLEDQKKFIKQLCGRLDPEDVVKIIRVSQDAYLIYEGSAQHSGSIQKSMNEFTKYDNKEWGTAYGEGMDKALGFASSMKKEGYNPSIVVIGDLENEGDAAKQLNWDTLPSKIQNVKVVAPELVVMFVYAHPKKLDLVKSKLSGVLGEERLIISTEQNIDKTVGKFLSAIGR